MLLVGALAVTGFAQQVISVQYIEPSLEMVIKKSPP